MCLCAIIVADQTGSRQGATHMHEFQPLTQTEVVAALTSWNNGRRAGFPKGETVEPVWPNGAAPVIVGGAGGMECRTLLWGFPPPTGNKPVFNTRSEKLFEQEKQGRGFWSRARRCLVPTRGIWEPSPQGDVLFHVAGMPVFLMAGVCEGDRFSVVTVPASPDILPIHPRMPLILPRGFSHAWLQGAVPAECPRLERVDIV